MHMQRHTVQCVIDMTRSALPQNFCFPEMSLFEGFETASGWEDGYVGGTHSRNTSQFLTGSSSLKINVVSGTQAAARKTLTSGPPNLRGQVGSISIYLHNPAADFTSISLLHMQSDTVYAVYPLYATSLVEGWNTIRINPATWQWVGTGAKDLPKKMLQIKIVAATGKTPSISVDSLNYGRVGKPICVLGFDADSPASIYDVAFPILQAHGKVGTIYVVEDKISSESGNITIAELQEMVAAGNSAGNHSKTHADFRYITEAEAIVEYESCRDFLIANGMPNAADHFAYPVGVATEALNSLLASLGAKSARSNLGVAYGNYPWLKSGDMYVIGYGLSMTTDTTNAQIDAAVDACSHPTGQTLMVLLHGVEESPTNPNFCNTTQFEYLMNKLEGRGFRFLTIDEWYNGLTNPRYRSLPVGRA